jgi:hypothetical protein
MSKSSKKTAHVAPEQVAPEAEVATTQTEPKAKPVRYATKDVLVPNARITWVKENPKRGKSAVRYAQFYRVGVTLAELEEAYKSANLTRMLARADVRWDVQHGNIQLEMPAAAE